MDQSTVLSRYETSFAEAINAKFACVERTMSDMHDYQLDIAVPFLLENPYSALFIDCGLGKTVISLTVAMRLIAANLMRRILIVGPVRVVNETWPTEIGLWEHTAPLTFSHIREDDLVKTINYSGRISRAEIARLGFNDVDLGLPPGEIKERVRQARMDEARRLVRQRFQNNRTCIHLINREQVEFLVEVWGRDWPYDVVFIDESSAFKDHRTGRFKALRRVRPLIRRFHELTATPVAETYEHLFAQIYLLDQGKRLGKSITNYRERYFSFNKYTFKYTLRPGAEEEIVSKISDICLSMKGEDYLDLDEPIFIPERIILPSDQMALYKEMERDYIITLPDGTEIEAENSAAKSQKLQQMSSGVIYENVVTMDEFGECKHERVVHHLHDHKIEKLKEIIEASDGENIIVAYHLKSSLQRLKKVFPEAVVMDKDGKCIKDWNAGKIKILLLSPQSAGHGLNIQKGGRRLVFFDIPWSFEYFYQCFKRLARQGQTLLVMIHFLTVVGTIDIEIVAALTEKDMTQEKFFAILNRIRRKYEKLK